MVTVWNQLTEGESSPVSWQTPPAAATSQPPEYALARLWLPAAQAVAGELSNLIIPRVKDQ
jgi:hypothetical protein